MLYRFPLSAGARQEAQAQAALLSEHEAGLRADELERLADVHGDLAETVLRIMAR